MIDVSEEKEVYLSDFHRLEKELASVGSPALHRLRQTALERFEDMGFPGLDDEEWRFTPLAGLHKHVFRCPHETMRTLDQMDLPTVEDLLARLPGAEHGIVFLNGQLMQPPRGIEDLRVQSLIGALAEHGPEVEKHLGRHAAFEEQPLAALNTAFVRDGAYVHVPRGVVVQRPIYVVYASSTADDPCVCHPRTLIVAEENSQATVVEAYLGRAGDVYFTNAVTEVVLAENAIIDHYKLQMESQEAFHIATLQVRQARSSTFSTHSLSFGGQLVRNDVNAVLDGEGCESTLNGLYLAGGSQLVDNHTRIDHARPHCASHELYKGILDGKARGVFNGKIYVHKDAQKTDAKQTNKTLLLSQDATINTKPQLEIFADDVKCTHGATIGQLDADSLFYLRARGIGLSEARALLTYAFANDIVTRIKVDVLQQHLEKLLLAQAGKGVRS